MLKSEQRADTKRSYRQACPVAHALDMVGERWTLLIVRDLMFGPLRFTDLRNGLTGIASNLLSDRLRMLEAEGVVQQVELPPPAARSVYALTDRGRELAPIIHGLARFGVADWADPDLEPPPPRLVRGALLALMDPDRLGSSGWSALIELGDATTMLRVRRADHHSRGLDRIRLSAATDDRHAEVTLTTSLGTLLALRRHELTRAASEATARLTVAGPVRVIDQLAHLFGWT